MSSYDDVARHLLLLAFPGEGFRAGKLLLEISDGRLTEDVLPSLVQEHYEEHHLPVSEDSRVIVSGLSRIILDDSDPRYGVYWNPIDEVACRVDFATLTIVEKEHFTLTPNPLRDRLANACSGQLQVFAPPVSPPLFVAMSSTASQDPGNFSAVSQLRRFDFQPEGGKLRCTAATAELRSLSYEDGVFQLALSVLFAEGVSGSPEELGEWASKCAVERLGGDALLEGGSRALKQLRRQLPVHKQRFDWNLNRVVGLLP